MKEKRQEEEIFRLRAQLAALEELLSVHEQTVREQSDRLENTLSELTERQAELEGLTHRLAVARDQALDASRLKSQFLANVSHEIRTPISSVIGMTELLLDTELNETQRRFATIVRQSAQSLLAIINDILDLSKLEAGKVVLSATEFDPASVIQAAVDLLAPAAKGKALPLNLYIDPALPARLIGDPVRLRQILVNLLSNALKFTEAGGVEVGACLDKTAADRPILHLSVTDTGIGLSESAVEKLFQPFVQLDGSTTRKYGGTGLGLSISRHLAEAMGGQIGVRSQEGVGSTFWCALPFQSAGPERQEIEPAVAAAQGSGRQAGAPAGRARPLVLIVEDNLALQELARRQIVKLGFQAEVVGTGEQAVEAVGKCDYALVLMDCQMPGMDGYQAARAIRQKERSGLRQTPIIAMTAGAVKGERERCLAAGMDDYLLKPASLADLEKMLRTWAKPSSPDKDNRAERL